MSRRRGGYALALAVIAAGCGDIDPEWQLDHNRIVAVRMTPPHIPAGSSATIDALIAFKGSNVAVESPDVAEIAMLPVDAGAADGLVVPPSLQATAVTQNGSAWTVTAPDEDAIDAARTFLGLPAGSAVPLTIGVAYNGSAEIGLKDIYFGDSADNPTLTSVMINSAPAPDPSAGTIIIPTDTDVPLSIDAPDDAQINWLTSCGTMHDDDEHTAFIHVNPGDRMYGQLVVVERDDEGGVAFETWDIQTDMPGSGSGSGSGQ